MKFGSLCSGIEAASAAWHPLGWEAQFFSEIEPFPCSVLAHHYPEVPNHGDMTKFKEWPHHDIDVLVGGTPCQSFSVAGLRKGLADPRGNLMLTYLAIADKYRPEWLVWENVPGVLSSNGGKDFGTFLGGLAELGYGFAYRVLDAQHFGVPQRRRRVFVVGCLGDWRRAAAVLFERHSLSGDPAPSREKGQAIAGTLASRTEGGGFPGTDEACSGYVQPVAVHGTQDPLLNDIAFPLGRNSGQENAVAYAVRTANTGANGHGISPELSHTLDGAQGQAVAYAFAENSRHEVRLEGGDGQRTGALSTGGGKPGQGTPMVAVSVALRGREGGATAELGDEVAGCLRASVGGGDKPYVLTSGVTIHGTDKTASVMSFTDICGSLRTKPPGSIENSSTTAVYQNMAVRRLTPRECERLQGFPDDYTLVPQRGKPAADGPRYKVLGNSMAVPVMAWIGRRIESVASIESAKVVA